MSTDVWRFSDGESCAVFEAFMEFSLRLETPECASRERIPIFLEVFRGRAAIKVSPAKDDESFFATLVERELSRLAELEAELELGCGHTVFSHRHFLQQFRNRYKLVS